MRYKNKVGLFGEEIARQYLTNNDYAIISVNKKISFKEIDILAKKNGMLIFVEVKTRTNDIYGDASDSFGSRKTENLKNAILQYILEENIDENKVQIDLIAVDINKIRKIANIKHYKNIF